MYNSRSVYGIAEWEKCSVSAVMKIKNGRVDKKQFDRILI